MKKSLLTLCMAAAAMSASADVYTFIVDGCDPVRRSHADKTHQTVIPFGYYGIKAGDHDKGDYIATLQTPKALVSDAVMIEDVAEGNFTCYGSWRLLKDVPVKVTPAAGLTVTKIRVQGSVPNYNQTMSIVTPAAEGYDKVADFIVNKEDTTNTWTGSYAEPFMMACTSNGGKSYYMRAIYMEITVEGTSTQVAVPVCNKTLPIVAKNEPISLTCPTEGAKIYYTVSYDGSTQTPTTASTLYTGPFTLNQDAVVRAIAVKDGMTASFPIYKEYYVVPANVGVAASFDFTDFTSLKFENGTPLTAEDLSDGYPVAKGGTSTYTFTNAKFADNGYTITGTGTVNTNVVVSDAYGQACEVRTTKTNSGIVVEAPAGKAIKALLIQGSRLAPYKLTDGISGTMAINPINKANMLWRAPEGEAVSKVSIYNSENSSRYISRVYALVDGAMSGIADVEADMVDENAPVEYYNLQGVRVANPQNGIFIKRQGAKATKVYVK